MRNSTHLLVLCLLAGLAGCDDSSDGGGAAADAAAVDLDMALVDTGGADMALLPDAGPTPDMMSAADLGPDAAPIPNPPTIGMATARLNRDDNGLGLMINGMDPDNNVAGITIELFTPAGQLDGLRAPVEEGMDDVCGAWSSSTPTSIVCVRFDRLQQGLGNFDGIWSFGYRDGSVFERLVTMRVSVFDDTGERSQVIDAIIADTPVVPEGEQCDLNRGITKCDTDFMCGSVAGGRRACQEALPFCPEFYNVVDLNSRDGLSFSGDTTGQGSHGSGSCGGGAGDQVLEFKADLPGRYHFRVEVNDPAADDTVMWIRSHCRFADWKAELACNDDTADRPDDLSSSITLEMDFNETVYVFVGGFLPSDGQPGWQGPFTLTATYLGE